jgi:prepilin-type N-terminal cleavage/methylation domain-containing protein
MATRATNNKGFSLIELLIAMMIIMISMLALATATGNFIRVNLENEMRNTATRIANQTTEALYSLPFNDPDLAPGVHNRILNDAGLNAKGIPNTLQTVRGSRQTFNIQWTVVQQTNEALEVRISVSYTIRGTQVAKNAVIYKHVAI